MATWAIGDLHGCWHTLQALLDRIEFDHRSDRLWLVGDLVNRGPRSLAVLRWARQMGERLLAVLGNHDLHLLARAAGLRSDRPRDTLDEVLEAPDSDDLLDWLRHRPLLARDGEHLLVHAGLLPAWDLDLAERLARQLEADLVGDDGRRLLAATQIGQALPAWEPALDRATRLRLALFSFTNLRTVRPDGAPEPRFSGPPAEAPDGCEAWFALPSRRPTGVTVICGHWAALGLHCRPGVRALDSGAAWGGPLTALRIDDGTLIQQPNLDGTTR